MKDNKLRVQIDSGCHNTDAQAYLHALQATIDGLTEVDKASSRFRCESIRWEITDAGKNSPLFTSIAGVQIPSATNGIAPSDVIDGFVGGLAYLEDHAECPPYFNQKSLKIVETLTQPYTRGVGGIEFSTLTGIVARMSRDMAKNANRARRVLELEAAKLGNTYIEYGSIEGQILATTTTPVLGDDSVTVIDDLTRDEITCYFKDPRIEKQARDNWKRRVSVRGKITVNRSTGRPEKMNVEEITPLPGRCDLPQMNDLHGIDITHGVESARYIDELRDAE